jgi:hypothetical protein
MECRSVVTRVGLPVSLSICILCTHDWVGKDALGYNRGDRRDDAKKAWEIRCGISVLGRKARENQ